MRLEAGMSKRQRVGLGIGLFALLLFQSIEPMIESKWVIVVGAIIAMVAVQYLWKDGA